MKTWLCLLTALALSSSVRGAWELDRFEGRDYVTLTSLAEFYELPAPPIALPSAPEHPMVGEFLPLPIPTFVPATSIALRSEAHQLKLELQSRDAEIDGVRHWLSFPVIVQNGKVLISRIDLTKIIEPRLRPNRIDGLGVVDTVVLDPGHGGHDRGAISKLGFEKDFALDVARRARTLLEAQGYKVVMTRSADIFIPLRERAALANGITNSIFVSIHFNSTNANRNARGFEIFSLTPRGAPSTGDNNVTFKDLRAEPGHAMELPSSALAASVYTSLLGQVPALDRGLKQARFAVLRHCTVPAVLVECGFVSNLDEVSQISSADWREKVASAIVDGIDGYKLLAEKRRIPRSVAEFRAGR